jgi:hypothetical protein
MLSDELRRTGEALRATRGAGSAALPYLQMAEDIGRSVRFSLDDDVTRAAEEIVLGRPSSMLAALSYARLPAPQCWIEWVNGPRLEVPVAHGRPLDPENTDYPKRVGALVREAPDGGFEASVAWNQDGSPPTVSAADIEFAGAGLAVDEAKYQRALDQAREAACIPHAVASIHARRPGELEAFTRLAMHFDVGPGRYAPAVTAGFLPFGAEVPERLVDLHMKDVSEEWSFLAAVLLLLNSRNGVERREEGYGRLNRARLKSGKLPLFTHSTVRLRLARGERLAAGLRSGWAAGSRREGVVLAHFKVRRTGVFLWRMHMRGDPSKGTVTHDYRVGA